MSNSISAVFSKNRAEENPDDLWGRFVLPLNYNTLNLLNFDKGVRVVGGRGSGKTSFLKFHCYKTQLSSTRKKHSQVLPNKIGIYWKPDTNFTQIINNKYLGETWTAVFKTYIELSLLRSFSEFIQFICKSDYIPAEQKIALSTELIPNEVLKMIDNTKLDIKYTDLASLCRSSLTTKLTQWVNYRKGEIPINLTGKELLALLISELQDKGYFKDKIFHIFIDEFENLHHDQQKIINTWMKHGQNPLLFSVAFKKYSNISDETLGSEYLQHREDFRYIDIIEDVYERDQNSFSIVASEILISKLQENLKLEKFINTDELSDANFIEKRQSENYQKKILGMARSIFPVNSYDDIAREIISDKTLFDRLKKNVATRLKEKKYLQLL